MNYKSIKLIYKLKKAKTKQLIKEIKSYINSSPNGLDLFWFLMYLDPDFIFKIISTLEKDENWIGIEKVLEVLPYVRNNKIFTEIVIQYLQHPNPDLQIASLRFFRITGRSEYLQLFDFLLHTNNKLVVKELIETVGYTSPPNAIILLKKIEEKWGNLIPPEYYIRAKIEIGVSQG